MTRFGHQMQASNPVEHINNGSWRKKGKDKPMHKALEKKKGMSKETMKDIQKGNLGGFMKKHYPKN